MISMVNNVYVWIILPLGTWGLVIVVAWLFIKLLDAIDRRRKGR